MSIVRNLILCHLIREQVFPFVHSKSICSYFLEPVIMELIWLHHPFHWEFVRFSWFYTHWIIWDGIVGILNIVIRLWVMFKFSGDIWALLFALPGNGHRCFRMYILTCLLWAMVLTSVQFLKTLQCYSGLFCFSISHQWVWILARDGGRLSTP